MDQSVFIERIQRWLAIGEIEEALKELRQLGEKLGFDFAVKGAITLSGSYNSLKDSMAQGRLSPVEFKQERDGIQESVQHLLDKIRSAPPAPPLRSPREKGRLVHNIPARMSRGIITGCIVRIAKDDQTLLQNFPLPEDNKPEDISISATMSVELLNPSGEQVFEISTISSRVQTIGNDDYTQWIFDVKPLREGSFLLILKVCIVEMVEGVERSKDIVLERPVDIVSEGQHGYVSTASLVWTSTPITYHYSNRRAKIWPLGAFVSAHAHTISLTMGILAAGITLFLLVKSLVPSTPLPQLQQAVLQMDTSVSKPIVRLNSKRIKGWKVNRDTTEITLPPLPAGTYLVEVEGANAICRDSIRLTSSSTRFRLPCSFIQLPSAQPDSSLITLITPFDRPNVKVDDDSLDNISSQPAGRNQYSTTVQVRNGLHTFKVSDPDNRFDCTKTNFRIEIQGDTMLQWQCKPVIKRFTVRLTVPEPTAGRNYKSLKIKMDNRILEIEPEPLTSNGAVFILRDIPAGRHQFSIGGLSTGYICNALTKNIKRNSTIQFNCAYSEGLTVILSVPVSINFSDENIKNLRIQMDDVTLSQVFGKRVNNFKKTTEIVFTIQNVPRGMHRFQVTGLARPYYCDELTLGVDVPVTKGSFRCRSN